MRRYAQLFWVQLRASLQTSMQYRTDFFLGGVMSLFWMAFQILPMLAVWRLRPVIAGWDLNSALLVLAFFLFLLGLLNGAVQPAIVSTVDHIRKGTLDFILLKPADAQFLVSTTKLEPWHALDLCGAAALAIFAMHRLHHTPSPTQLALALLLLLGACAFLYSLAILIVSAAFWVVRLDNLIYLFSAVFDAARWPATVFVGFWRLLFTFVVPLILMTTYPALALLGKLSARETLAACGGSIIFGVLSRLIWLRAIGRYTSASS